MQNRMTTPDDSGAGSAAGPIDDTVLQRMADAIVDATDPEQVILFGSRARGEARPESDVDLVVIETEPFGPGRDRRAEAARIWRALADIEAAADILVYSRDEVEYWRDSRNNMLARALREGKVLYERRNSNRDRSLGPVL